MEQPWIRLFKNEPYRSIIYLISLVIIKLIILIKLYSQGYISVAADEFSRGIRAAKWALQPSFNLLADVNDTWLPFEKYLNGLLLRIWPDVIWAPRVTVLIASCLVLIALFILIYELFRSFPVAALAVAFVVFQPWYTWLSGTPMLEMYYLSCFLAGLVFIVMWLKKGSRGFWFWAGCCFFLASGFHVQSWTYINIVNLLTIGFLYKFLSQKQFKCLIQLIGFYIMGNLLIITFSLISYWNTSHLFGFLINHTQYSKWFYNGYNIPVLEKLIYYPQLIIQNSSGAIWALLVFALIFLVRDQDYRWKLFPLAVGVLALGINCTMNIISVPATAAPARYSMFYVLMLSPYIASGTNRLFTFGRQWSSHILSYTPSILSAGLFLSSLWWGFVQTQNFPHGMSLDAIETGYYLNQMLNRNAPGTDLNYLVELKYWDFLGVQLTAGHYDAVIFDREYDIYNRNNPSIFLGQIVNVYTLLRSQNIQYVALHDPGFIVKTQQMEFLHPIRKIGGWHIYEFKPNP